SASKKKEQAAPKKVAKREAEADAEVPTTTPTAKRRKKDPEILAAELREKAKAQEEKAEKAHHKKDWEEWQKAHDVDGKLLDAEPEKEESITQTDSQKKYGLKPTELGSLLHFEKRHPTYNNTTKLFLEKDVKQLAFRKHGILASGGKTKDSALLRKGEEVWNEEYASSAAAVDDAKKKASSERAQKPKTPKQKWTEYVSAHALPTDADNKLVDEPKVAVNQTESKAKYHLTPADLACLPFFAKKNPAYGNTIKLFSESEVQGLAWRKAAVLAGVEEGDDEVEFLEKGREAFEE
ncbi:uncharacterized protein K460DRAFT_253242, partial [Cucurbitaria berberidis CBS 394.84]